MSESKKFAGESDTNINQSYNIEQNQQDAVGIINSISQLSNQIGQLQKDISDIQKKKYIAWTSVGLWTFLIGIISAWCYFSWTIPLIPYYSAKEEIKLLRCRQNKLYKCRIHNNCGGQYSDKFVDCEKELNK